MRSLPAASYYAIKGATRRLIERLGGLEAAAEDSRVEKSTLGRYQSTGDQDVAHFIPADVLADLERAAGDPLVTRELARLQGFGLCRLEDQQACPARITVDDIVEQTLALNAAVGKHSEAVSEAVRDRDLSLPELQTLEKTLAAMAMNESRLHDMVCRLIAARKNGGEA